MGVTRYRDGGVTITLGDELERLVKRAVEAAGGPMLAVMQRKAEELASQARTAWYARDGVKRRTGRSGDIQVVTTVIPSAAVVSVGSTDIELVGNKPRAVLVHHPGPLSTIAQEITQPAYKDAKARGLHKLVWRARRDKPSIGVKKDKYYMRVPNPLAADGKYLVAELLRKPGRVLFKAAIPELTAAFAAAVGGT